jgi:hypothetical protein
MLHTVEIPSDEPEKPKEAAESEKKSSAEGEGQSGTKASEAMETDSTKTEPKDSDALKDSGNKSLNVSAEPFAPPNVTAPPNYGPPPNAAQSQQHNAYPGYSAPYDGYAQTQAGYPSLAPGGDMTYASLLHLLYAYSPFFRF